MKINKDDLKLLLEQKKDAIGSKRWEGIEEILSGITLFLSIASSTFNDTFGLKADTIWVVAISLALVFLVVGFIKLIKNNVKHYSHDDLYNDILGINENDNHPFSIVLLKDDFNVYSNKYLLFKDVNWNCKLFLNYHVDLPINIEQEKLKIKQLLENDLHIDKNLINVDYLRRETVRKYSHNDKVKKKYDFLFFHATINQFNDLLENQHFKIDGKNYYWMSITEMELNNNIMKKNKDVIQIVKNKIQI